MAGDGAARARARRAATVLLVVVDAGPDRVAEVERDLDRFAPGGFCTSSRLRSASWAPLPAGYVVMNAAGRRQRWAADEQLTSA